MNDDHPLQFQLPSFVYNVATTLVPGGGAEVVHASNREWFANNGFDYAPNSYAFDDPTQQPLAAEQYESSSPPFNFAESDVSFPPPSPAAQPDISVLSSLAVPSPYGLPVYSVSGFDILSILSRVHHRPNPTIHLGPVDLTTSFVVSDARRYDAPIVYCSPNFSTLTGYSEPEIVGRNCRFLQAPGGQVAKGEPRRYTSQDSANLLRKSLISGKDCQTSIVNYKKDGSAFINLVTVITLYGDDKEPLYHVGFQVDLTEQPNAILEKLQNGTYNANFEPRSEVTTLQNNPPSGNARDRRVNSIPPLVMSQDLKHLLDEPSFLRSFSIPTTAPSSATLSEDSVSDGSNQLLHLFLLDTSPDFIHVVSLKGNFLYVAPSVRRVLGYESEEMMGSSIADYAHPEDVVPLMRELKESSATGINANTLGSSSNNNNANGNAGNDALATTLPIMPRSVDLLFRAKTKMGRYVWVECRGRLYVEPGKGRKAIILSGRAREMMSLRWEDVNLAGGLAKIVRQGRGKESKEIGREVWGTLGGTGKETATFMSVGQGVQDVLGWTSDELLGSALMDIILDEFVKVAVGGFIQSMREYQRRRFVPVHRRAELDSARHRKIRCRMRKRDGSFEDVCLILYRADLDDDDVDDDDVEEEGGGTQTTTSQAQDGRAMGMSISPASLVFQIRVFDAETDLCGPGALPVPSPNVVHHGGGGGGGGGGGTDSPPASTSPPSLDLFEELSIARGSSWQYELQQLRFANARLEEELAALEMVVDAAEARKAASSVSAAATSNLSSEDVDSSNGRDGLTLSGREKYDHQMKQHQHQHQHQQHQHQQQHGVSTYTSGFDRPPPPPPPPPPLPHQELFSRGQLVIPEHAYVHGTGGGGVYESMGIQPFLYHPKPQYSSSQGLNVLSSDLDPPRHQQNQKQNERGLMSSSSSSSVARGHGHGHGHGLTSRSRSSVVVAVGYQAQQQQQQQQQQQHRPTQTWGTMPSLSSSPPPSLPPAPPAPPPPPPAAAAVASRPVYPRHHVSPQAGAGVKRSWSAIDSA